jgi:acetyl esterase/lipase
MQKQFKPTLLLAIIVLFMGCSKDSPIVVADEYDPSKAKTLLNAPYGTKERQKADVYLPAGRNSNTPIIILLHGGSWTEGNKEDLNEVVNLIKAQWPAAALININYTLATNSTPNYHPAQMNDISRLLEYLDEKRSLWKLGNKTAITGVSAGAHLGMLYAYGYNTGNKVKAIVSVVGPADFSDPLYVSSPIFQLVATSLLGKSWIEDANLHRSASPALRVSATSPPTFMAYGALDQLVPLSNAATLRSRLQANNITHTYVEYPAEGHEFTNTAINDLVPRVISFLKTNL